VLERVARRPEADELESLLFAHVPHGPRGSPPERAGDVQENTAEHLLHRERERALERACTGGVGGERVARRLRRTAGRQREAERERDAGDPDDRAREGEIHARGELEIAEIAAPLRGARRPSPGLYEGQERRELSPR